ncbi:beta-ketoacyl synthase domain-containing protein [Poronia punctata]|nr:beta-ketoacyl synthase domain-containing protein [Poronia punctata]
MTTSKKQELLQEPIAIVGSSCRFAGQVDSPSKLWDVLCKTPDLSREVPSDRFNAQAFYHEDAEYHGTTNSIKAYWLDRSPAQFDAAFFNITPKEAEAMDPQQRLMLEVVYDSMESAGYPLTKYNGEAVGVFAGCMTQDYETLSGRDELNYSQYFATGNSRALLANRVSYFFNFNGPSMTIDTACSSSLVAMHQAILSLRAGDCVMACVTGANALLMPDHFVVESSLHMLSPQGKCHMWDIRADGYARGEGAASLLLKPLSRALADGDTIEAVIRQTGINADGKTNGITLPNPIAQASLIQKTYRDAGLDPKNPVDRCQYFEAHGTGTGAGDPKEASAIHEAFFGHGATSDKKLLVGSVKTIIGHTEAAAGLAGVLKVAWGMKHGMIPPNLHFETLNPSVAPFYKHLQIPTKMTPWPAPALGQPRRASVNSFGFGGSNAHAIIEQYTPSVHGVAVEDEDGEGVHLAFSFSSQSSEFELLDRSEAMTASQEVTVPSKEVAPFPIVISASSVKSLRKMVESYRQYLTENDVSVVELSWHQCLRRTSLPYSLAFSAVSTAEVLSNLDSFLVTNDTSNSSELVTRLHVLDRGVEILGVFTGQGAQWPSMGVTLLRQNEIYRGSIRTLDKHLQNCPHPPTWSLEEIIMTVTDESVINEASKSQPLCTALQIALVDFLYSVGIMFHTVVGHSSGEIAAAYAAGRITAEDAIVIAHYRGLVAPGADAPKGAMCAVGMSESQAEDICNNAVFKGRLCIAASNSPGSITLSGDLDAIDQVQANLVAQDIFARKLKVTTAYHSHHMHEPARKYSQMMQEYGVKPMSEELARNWANHTVWISSVEGRPRNNAQDLDCQYWADNMVRRVDFRAAVAHALSGKDTFDCVVEVGPNPTLRGPFTETAKAEGADDLLYTSLLKRNKDGGRTAADFLAQIWANFGSANVQVDEYIKQYTAQDPKRLHDVPRYEFLETHHWREPRVARQHHFKTFGPHELLGVRAREDNSHELMWRNVLKLEKMPWLEHHSFQGQALVPASAYCVMALDAARQLVGEREREASLVELCDVQIMSGIAMDRDSPGVETLFSVKIEKEGQEIIEATFSLYSCLADGRVEMNKHVSGKLHIVLESPSMDVLPSRQPLLAETSTADPETFYKSMEAVGLTYTGPFRAITSIERRYKYCSTTLSRFHAEDTTKLDISPATLDSSFQGAFLSYSSPFDGSLWTSFLPTTIGRIQFNIAALNGDREETLTVDSHIVSVTPPAVASKENIAVDISIFNARGETEIIVEDLTVRALSNAQPKDDLELYLQSVLDVDPTDEIVQYKEGEVNTVGMNLIDSCCRISDFCDGGRDETKADIEAMIRKSPYSSYLESLLELGERDPKKLAAALPGFVREAPELSIYRTHVGRIVKQITHRYPWMDILYLTGAKADFAKPILAAIDTACQSFTVGFTQRNSAVEGEKVMTSPTERVFFKDVDLTKGLGDQIGLEKALDLILLPTTLLENGKHGEILNALKEIMNPGAFLILVSPQGSVINTVSGSSYTASGRGHTPTYWADVLHKHGFTQEARHADQVYRMGAVLVRQLKPSVPDEVETLATQNLLLIKSSASQKNDELAFSVGNLLSRDCEQVTSRTIDNATAEDLQDCTAVIILADLDEPVMANMTEHRINQLRALLRPNLTALWVTRDSRSRNPEHAASFGFIRTMVAEIPNLRLQVLDLDSRPVERVEDTIATTFIRLVSSGKYDNTKSMWTYENEIHMENGKRLVPRIMPWKEANERVNSLRRLVDRPLNTLVQCVELCISPGSFRFEARHKEQNGFDAPHGNVVIRVDFSSALPFNMNGEVSAYICAGREWSSGERVVAISNSNLSYITVPVAQTCNIQDDPRNNLTIVHQFVRAFAASAVISTIDDNEEIVLVDPDVDFVKYLMQELASSKVTIVGTLFDDAGLARYNLFKEEHGRFATHCLHQRTSRQDIRRIFARRGVVFNFLPQDHHLTNRIRTELNPKRYTYHQGTPTFCSGELMQKGDFSSVKTIWKKTIMSTRKLFGTENDSPEFKQYISIKDITQMPSIPANPFQIVNWKAARDSSETIGYTVKEDLLSPNKTYILFGLTRDLGHSLCRLFLENGAQNIVVASRNPNMTPHWAAELRSIYGANIVIERADVTSLDSLLDLKSKLAETMPPVGGLINGCMVLDDRVFAQMTLDCWTRVLNPKTIGSANLDTVFSTDSDLEFFIMTSSFAATGGHAGQSNYATANMYMNGLAANRRRRGLAGTALNIGVIYGLGFLQREKNHLYAGLEREGYPPISEHDLHHMFLEAIVAGRPDNNKNNKLPYDITTGLRRFRRGELEPLHWHLDPRFCHFARHASDEDDIDAQNPAQQHQQQQSVLEKLAEISDKEEMASAIGDALEKRMEMMLQIPEGSIDRNNSISSLGVDSLAAVEVRNWLFKVLDKDVPVMKILGTPSIQKLCLDMAEQILAGRE